MSDKIENFLNQYSETDRKSWRGKPANLVKIAVIDDDKYYSTVFLYSERGKAMIALGCRRFTIGQAYTHWGSIHAIYDAWKNRAPDTLRYSDQQRAARAKAMVETVIAKAIRSARRRGWNTGGY